MTVAADGPRENGAFRRRGLGPRFWALWAANTCSGLGDGLNAVALPLLAASITSRPVVIAGVLFAQRVPWLVVGLPAGAHADRVNQPRLMRRMDLTRAAALAAVTVVVALWHMTIPLIYLFAVIMGVCEPFFSAANQATLPAVVPRDLLIRSNGLLEIGQTSAEETVGPALGGIVYSIARAVPFALDALSFIGSASFLLGLGRPPRHPGVARRGPRETARQSWADTRIGLTWYRRHHALVVVTATVAVLAFSQAMVSATLVLFAGEYLHLGPSRYGIFIGAVAVGNVIGGLIVNPILRRASTGPVLIAAVVLSAAGYLAAATTTSPVLTALLLGLEAVAVVTGSVATISFRQRAAPAELQARVASVWRTAIWGAIPLGALTGGAVAALGNLRTPFLAAGGVQLALAAIVARPLLRLLPAADD